MFEDFTMPIIMVLTTASGVTIEEAEAFNLFFSLMVGVGLMMLIPLAIVRLIGRS